MSYAVRANRVVAQSIALNAPGVKLETGRVSLTGVRWVRLLRGGSRPRPWSTPVSMRPISIWNSLRPATASVVVGCGRRCRGPNWSPRTELRTLVSSDEDFFAAQEFRTTRFHLVVPECRVRGIAYADLFEGRSYLGPDSIRVSRPFFDALVNRDKPVRPFVQSPLMVHEALGSSSGCHCGWIASGLPTDA